MNITLWLILGLFTKHFIADFVLQTQYQLSNKGNYLHLGGIIHSGIHGIGTFLVFYWYAPYSAAILAIIDMLIHYHIDWTKVYINKKTEWNNTNPKFWWLFGLDQYLHTLTYILLVASTVT